MTRAARPRVHRSDRGPARTREAALLDAIAAGAELAVGTRFGALATFRSTFARRAGNRLLARVVSWLSGRTLTDPTSGFRAFGGRALPYFAEHFPHDYPEPESLLWASRQGFDLREVPVRMRPRQAGQISLTPLRSAYYMLKVSLALILELTRSKPPAPPRSPADPIVADSLRGPTPGARPRK